MCSDGHLVHAIIVVRTGVILLYKAIPDGSDPLILSEHLAGYQKSEQQANRAGAG